MSALCNINLCSRERERERERVSESVREWMREKSFARSKERDTPGFIGTAKPLMMEAKISNNSAIPL